MVFFKRVIVMSGLGLNRWVVIYGVKDVVFCVV